MHVRWFVPAVSLVAAAAVGSDAAACGWDDEVYAAEERTLPCLSLALTSRQLAHTPKFYETRLRAAQTALEVDPFSTWALDMAGVALMKLHRLPEAEAMMKKRLEIAPDAYASHANLGTVYTFTGDFDRALIHIDRAMKIEPKAHFGREKYHRRLVTYLASVKKEPGVHDTENFLGVPVTDDDRKNGDPTRFDLKAKAAGIGRDVFDALDAMLTVYGAEDNPHVLAAAGDMLALFGTPAYAAIAYEAAIKRGHPAKKHLTGAYQIVWKRTVAEWKSTSKGQQGLPLHTPEEYVWIVENRKFRPNPVVETYQTFEKKQLEGGLAVWTKEGLATLYAERERLGERCEVGRTMPGLDSGAKAGAP